ncbi:uncharacterized protein ACJ7VT_006353 isoform 2-T2 [Polymixia lowei]
MEAVFGLLVLLTGVSCGVETYCDARMDKAQCYGALGGAVNIQLITQTTQDKRYKWYRNNTQILNVRNNVATITDKSLQNRTSFTVSNGTFRMSNIKTTDDAEYVFYIFNETGAEVKRHKLQMSVQVPVSSPKLSSECLSHGERRVSCTVEGDSPQYSWTLDGHTLMDTGLLSGNNETNSITLKLGLSGQLVCLVKNYVSHDSVNMNISICEGFIYINCTLSNGTYVFERVPGANNTLCIKPTITMPESEATTMVYIAVSLSAVVILLVVVVGVYCAQMKKKTSKAQDIGDEQDITYDDVRFLKRQGRQKEKREETEVEYGQVKVSGGGRQTVETVDNDCMYAKVKHHQ